MYDKKLDYITAELKRASGKRYESYVVNRIWGLVCDLPLRPRTQMYAKTENGRRFVDLCFPDIGIAIEVDEGQHAWAGDADKERERQISASDIIDGLYDGKLEFERVQVYDKPIEEIEKHIQAIAGRVSERARNLSDNDVWGFLDAKAWCASHDVIKASDSVRFGTIAEALNCTIGTQYKLVQRAYFTPSVFRGTDRDGWKVWFPKLTVGDEVANKWGSQNTIDPETGEIIETRYSTEEHKDESLDATPTRIVFVKEHDKITKKALYRFAGIYREARMEKGKAIYRRIADSMAISH